MPGRSVHALGGLLWAGAVLGAGCGQGDLRGPQTVRTIVYDAGGGEFILADRRYDTLADLTTLRGDTTEFRTAARLVLDARSTAAQEGCERFAQEFVEDAGRRPSLTFIEDGGAWVPEDFDALVMASTYYNFELARELFLSAGVEGRLLSGTTTFYEPRFIEYDPGGRRTFGADNAAFVPCITSFLVFAGERLQDIPLGANPGVAAHEYGHMVFDRVLFGEKGDAAAAPLDLSEEAVLLAALDEGMADFFGALTLGDPNFAARSLTRNASRVRDLKPGTAWSQELEDAALASADPHALGTAWGSFFWEVAEDTAVGGVGGVALALRALTLLRPETADFGTDRMLEAVARAAAEVDDAQATLRAVCASASSRFRALGPPPTDCARP